MRKIALIEDDADLFTLVKYNLEKEGFGVVGSSTGRGVIQLSGGKSQTSFSWTLCYPIPTA